jgi:Holliday junction resolvase
VKKKGYTIPWTTESQIERDIVQYLRLRGYMVLRTHGPRNRPTEDGIPDLLAYGEWKTLPVWIEVKTPEGRISEVQAEMHAALTERGARVIVARSIQDVEGL